MVGEDVQRFEHGGDTRLFKKRGGGAQALRYISALQFVRDITALLPGGDNQRRNAQPFSDRNGRFNHADKNCGALGV
ncbi:hypothetical protein SDC9_137318 [bioreactor metagenome]|uniref:Uncharacterized protein n=1 Tax=bioreactor metagenome TaxID=1076179 RepID=A0A645DLT1_9ZZZZ